MRVKNFLTPKWLKEFEEIKLQAASVKRQASGSKHKKRQASSSGGPAHNQAPNLVKKKI